MSKIQDYCRERILIEENLATISLLQQTIKERKTNIIRALQRALTEEDIIAIDMENGSFLRRLDKKVLHSVSKKKIMQIVTQFDYSKIYSGQEMVNIINELLETMLSTKKEQVKLSTSKPRKTKIHKIGKQTSAYIDSLILQLEQLEKEEGKIKQDKKTAVMNQKQNEENLLQEIDKFHAISSILDKTVFKTTLQQEDQQLQVRIWKRVPKIAYTMTLKKYKQILSQNTDILDQKLQSWSILHLWVFLM